MKKAVVALALLFLALETTDAFMTLWATSHGYQEINPLMAGITTTWLFPVIKIVPAIIAIYVLLHLSKYSQFSRLIAVLGFLTANTFVGLVIASNIAELIAYA
jgi:hypothetical protein